MRTLTKIALCAGLATVCITIGVAIGGAIKIEWNGATNITSVDLVTIVLSALSVMLALLTIFLAVFGFIGWSAINERLREHSMNYFTSELRPGRPSFDLLKSVVRGIVYEGIDPVDDDEAYPAEAENGPTAE